MQHRRAEERALALGGRTYLGALLRSDHWEALEEFRSTLVFSVLIQKGKRAQLHRVVVRVIGNVLSALRIHGSWHLWIQPATG